MSGTTTTIIGSLNPASTPTNLISTDLFPIQRSGLTYQTHIGGATIHTYNVIDDFQATGNGTTDDTTSIQSALTAIASGGNLYFPAGTYKISGLLNIPANCLIYGAGMGNTTINQTSAHFCFQLGQQSFINDMSLTGTSTAKGGVQLGTDSTAIGLGGLNRLNISNFTGTGAIAIYLNNCYRIQLNYLYCAFNTIGWFIGSTTTNATVAITTCQALKCEITACSSYAITNGTNGSGHTSCDLHLYTCYFEGNAGATDNHSGFTTMYINSSGSFDFDGCGFEDNTTIGGANASTIYANNPVFLSLDQCTYAGIPGTTTNALTGTASFIKTASGMPALNIYECISINNTAISGYNFLWLNCAALTNVTLIGNNWSGTAFANDAANISAMQGAQGVNGYSFPCSLTQINERFGATTVTKYPPLYTLPTQVTIAFAASGTNLYSQVLQIGTFSGGHGIKLRAWGTKTGTAGNKSINFIINGNTNTATFVASALTTTATPFDIDIMVIGGSGSDMNGSVMSRDGTALNVQDFENGTFTPYLNTITISLQAVIANSGDSITLRGVVLESF